MGTGTSNQYWRFLIDLKFLNELHFILHLLITLELGIACFKAFYNSEACNETVHVTGFMNI